MSSRATTEPPPAQARPSAADPRLREDVPGLREAAADLAFILARQGLKMAALPALALPPRIRRTVVAGARLPARAGRFLPRRVTETFEGVADDLQALEADLSHREDLGSRLRRERRQGLSHQGPRTQPGRQDLGDPELAKPRSRKRSGGLFARKP